MGSGLADLQTVNDRGIRCSLGTDISAAATLSLDDRIGNFLPGKTIYFVVLNPAATPLNTQQAAKSSTLEERLFVLTTQCNDRNARS